MLVVLQERTTNNLKLHYYWVVAFVVVSCASVVVALVSLFFAAGPRTESTSFDPSVASSALVEASMAARGSLDNDLDNDGQTDGVSGSLETSAMPAIGSSDVVFVPLGLLASVLLLTILLGRSCLLGLYNPLRLSTACCQPLERPG